MTKKGERLPENTYDRVIELKYTANATLERFIADMKAYNESVSSMFYQTHSYALKDIKLANKNLRKEIASLESQLELANGINRELAKRLAEMDAK